MREKRWTLATLGGFVLLMLLLGLMTVVVDPMFHYHAPLEGLSYVLNEERYQNDGILRHFDYDAVITGTSMTENFRTTEFDEIFGVQSVKLPYSGGSLREIGDGLRRAFAHNPDIRTVIWSLDMERIAQDKNALNYDGYPWYLYNESWPDDVQYVFNKEILLKCANVLDRTRDGVPGTAMDDYGSWAAKYDFTREEVMVRYNRPLFPRSFQLPFMDTDRTVMEGNLAQNVTDIVAAHPETEFYLFLPPYSVVWWDWCLRLGGLERQLAINAHAIDLLLAFDNIHIFGFDAAFDVTEDLENYKDYQHYSDEINSWMLRWMRDGTYEITRDNYRQYCDRVWTFYTEYDYDAVFA